MKINQVVKTIILTFLAMIIASAIFFCFMVMIFPKTSARFMYNLGNNALASKFYYKDYKNTNDITTLALALDLAIELEQVQNNNQTIINNIINYSNEFFSHANYSDYIEQLNARNNKMDLSILIKSTIINEDNYYKNIYINNLIKSKKIDLAFEFALLNFNFTPSTIYSIGSYMLSSFSNVHLVENFNAQIPDTDKLIIEGMVQYFYNLHDLFEQQIPNATTAAKPYLVALVSRMSMLASNISFVYENVEQESVLVDIDEVLKTAYHVSETMQTQLLGG